MNLNFNDIQSKYNEFYENCESLPDLETRLFNFLFSEIYNDLSSKEIKTLEDWLKYYSTDGNNLNEIVQLCNSYYEKVVQGNFELITFEEKVLGFNSLVLYAIEMDAEFPQESMSFRGNILATFFEIVYRYNLVLQGYLSVRGQILISNRSQCEFIHSTRT